MIFIVIYNVTESNINITLCNNGLCIQNIYLTVALTWSQLLCQLANRGVDVVRNYNAHCIIEMYFMTFFRSGCQSTEFIESRWQIQKYGEMVANSTYTHISLPGCKM